MATRFCGIRRQNADYMRKAVPTGGFLADIGAEEGTRTPDPLITNELLYQLSYFGVRRDTTPANYLADVQKPSRQSRVDTFSYHGHVVASDNTIVRVVIIHTDMCQDRGNDDIRSTQWLGPSAASALATVATFLCRLICWASTICASAMKSMSWTRIKAY